MRYRGNVSAAKVPYASLRFWAGGHGDTVGGRSFPSLLKVDRTEVVTEKSCGGCLRMSGSCETGASVTPGVRPGCVVKECVGRFVMEWREGRLQ